MAQINISVFHRYFWSEQIEGALILTLSEGGGEGGRAGRTSDNALGEGGESERQNTRRAVL